MSEEYEDNIEDIEGIEDIEDSTISEIKEKQIIKNDNLTSVDKNVYFYKISLTESSLIADAEARINDLKNVLNSRPIKINKSIDKNTKITIEEISKDDNYFFGLICKENDSRDFFTKIKTKDQNKVLENNDIIFTHFTYFYINYKSFAISCIVSKSIPTADSIIELLLNHNNVNLYEVIPLSKDLEEFSKYINSFRLSFAGVEDFEPMKALNKFDCDVKDYKVEAKLKKVGPKFLENLENFVNQNRKKVRIASVGNDAEDFNLLKQVFSRKAVIKVYSDYEENIDLIRKTLETELLKAI